MSGVLPLLAKLYLVLSYTAPVIFGFFCAYWAQETRRNPWVWFVFGVLLPPVTGIFLLMFNSDRHRRATPQGQNLGALIATRKDVV